MNNMSARQAALQIVNKINEDGAYTNIALSKVLSTNPLKDKRDIALVTEIVNGTIKNKIYIDHILKQFSKQKLEKLSPWIRNILRISAYQIIFLDKIPESAAVNEGVNLAKKYSHQGSVKFVNAVLRNLIRKKSELTFPSREENIVKYLSINYSFPLWLVEHFIKSFGASETENMLEYFNQVPDSWVRINTLKISLEEGKRIFSEKDIAIEQSEYIPEAFKIIGGYPLMRMEEYKEGLFSIQDETSMMAVDILDPLAGDNIIDVCSAPGGKTTFIAERMKNLGKIRAIEFYEHKLDTIKKYCKRNHINIVDVELGDAQKIYPKYPATFDKVLADVPCSGLGVLGKRPDLRYQADTCKFKEIRTIQGGILRSSAKILKEGGVLVYSTCTLNKEENQGIINEFLKENSNFEKMEIPEKYKEFLDEEGNFQTLPFRDNKNGFFVAKLRKRGL